MEVWNYGGVEIEKLRTTSGQCQRLDEDSDEDTVLCFPHKIFWNYL